MSKPSATEDRRQRETIQYPVFTVHQASNNLHNALCVRVCSRWRRDVFVLTGVMVMSQSAVELRSCMSDGRKMCIYAGGARGAISVMQIYYLQKKNSENQVGKKNDASQTRGSNSVSHIPHHIGYGRHNGCQTLEREIATR